MQIYQRDINSFFIGIVFAVIFGGLFFWGYNASRNFALVKSIPWCADDPGKGMSGTLPGGVYWNCRPEAPIPTKQKRRK